jgi:hypothetical protein
MVPSVFPEFKSVALTKPVPLTAPPVIVELLGVAVHVTNVPLILVVGVNANNSPLQIDLDKVVFVIAGSGLTVTTTVFDI